MTVALVASAATTAIVLLRSQSATERIREEAAEALLISRLDRSLQVTAAYAVELVAPEHGDAAEPPDDHDHPALGDHAALSTSLAEFAVGIGELGRSLDGEEARVLDQLEALHQDYAASLDRLHGLEQGGGITMDVYHGTTQELESELREHLIGLRDDQADDVESAVARSLTSARVVRWAIPLLTALSLGIGTALIRLFGARRRRDVVNLRKLNQEKDRFLASVSHELRTPLTGVLGFIELLRDEELAAADRRELLRLAGSEATDLANLVEDVLVAARSEEDALRIARVSVDVRAQIRQVLEPWDDPRVSSIEVTGRAHRADGDPARIRQILRNLVSNALKYGGDEIGIAVRGTGHWVEVAVHDSGPPIAAEERERVFRPYERASATAGRTDSVGLGLPVSRSLARRMGGDLVYEHHNGRSTFLLLLPVRDEHGKPVPPAGTSRVDALA